MTCFQWTKRPGQVAYALQKIWLGAREIKGDTCASRAQKGKLWYGGKSAHIKRNGLICVKKKSGERHFVEKKLLELGTRRSQRDRNCVETKYHPLDVSKELEDPLTTTLGDSILEP